MDNIDVENVPTGDGSVTDDDKLWALLGYIFPLIALIALLMEEKKNRPFIRYHAVQALILAVVIFITSFTVCGWAIVWIYSIYLGFKAYGGDWATIPFVTDFARNQGWL